MDGDLRGTAVNGAFFLDGVPPGCSLVGSTPGKEPFIPPVHGVAWLYPLVLTPVAEQRQNVAVFAAGRC